MWNRSARKTRYLVFSVTFSTRGCTCLNVFDSLVSGQTNCPFETLSAKETKNYLIIKICWIFHRNFRKKLSRTPQEAPSKFSKMSPKPSILKPSADPGNWSGILLKFIRKSSIKTLCLPRSGWANQMQSTQLVVPDTSITQIPL